MSKEECLDDYEAEGKEACQLVGGKMSTMTVAELALVFQQLHELDMRLFGKSWTDAIRERNPPCQGEQIRKNLEVLG